MPFTSYPEHNAYQPSEDENAYHQPNDSSHYYSHYRKECYQPQRRTTIPFQPTPRHPNLISLITGPFMPSGLPEPLSESPYSAPQLQRHPSALARGYSVPLIHPLGERSPWTQLASRFDGSSTQSEALPHRSNNDRSRSDSSVPALPNGQRNHCSIPAEYKCRLPLDMKQLSQGGRYAFLIKRRMLNGTNVDTQVDVDVQPGWAWGTRIILLGVGSERTPGTYQNVVFVLEQSHHQLLSGARIIATDDAQPPEALNLGWTPHTPGSVATGTPSNIDIPERAEDFYRRENGPEWLDRPEESSLSRRYRLPRVGNTLPPDLLDFSAINAPTNQQLHQHSFAQRPAIEQVEHLNRALESLGCYRIPLKHLDIDESSEIGKGGFGVVMRGTMIGYHSEVAIKRLRSDETRDIRVAKRLVREMKVWLKLKHPNILSLIGFHLSEALDLALIVCPLQPRGNIKDYLRQVKPSVPERFQLALDTLSAIQYLHNLDPPVVHGDIKALNVLMGDERQPLICDFGLALAADEVPTGLTTSKGLKGSMRYCSPELVMQNEPRRTPFSDMWAWGCLLVEIIRETIPYPHILNDAQVILAVAMGHPPESQELLIHPIDIWSIVQGCWSFDPRSRSTAETSAKDLYRLMESH
ncbi:hypothetical protein FRB94_004588 [Tulasnella sp. JGI-2019a]|nr:hypothetical protein FRB94_004588 [Tulasnella sp. JGI-2019a]